LSSTSDLAFADTRTADLPQVELGGILDEFADAVSALLQGAPAQLTSEQLSKAVGSIAQLFSACAQRAGRTDLIISDDLSTTEVVTLVEGLLAAQDLNVFDLALWLSRGGAARRDEKEAER
jgi:hypothetical protein